MKPKHLLLLLFVWLLGFMLPADVEAGTPPDHSWNPNRAVNAPYGLDDIDGFGLGDYEYCRWGNLQNSGLATSMNLNFTKLSLGNTQIELENEHYLQDNTGQLILFDSLTSRTWKPATPFEGGYVTIGQPSQRPLYLFRKLHFRNVLRTRSFAAIPPSTKKLILLVHGWNPDSNSYHYGAEFDQLYEALKTRIAGTGWELAVYNWEEDADTGGPVAINFHFQGETFFGPDPINPTEVATSAHLHGQHAGALLETLDNLENVHFIAHSAGSWLARSATRHLLQRTNKKVQITFLDPFIPGVMRTDSGAVNNTPLTKDRMDSIPQMDVGQNGDRSHQLYWLENIFSHDVDVGGNLLNWNIAIATDWAYRTTSQIFDWSGKDGVNQAVDWSIGSTPPIAQAQYYDSHSGPIEFYADTVIDADRSQPTRDGLEKFNLDLVGFRRSMFMNEPVIKGGGELAVGSGKEATLSFQVSTRRGRTDFSNFRWKKQQPGGGWGDVTLQPGRVDNNNQLVLKILKAQASDAGNYRLHVTRDYLEEVSPIIAMTVTGGTPSPGGYSTPAQPPSAPTNVIATATSSTSVSVSWDDSPNGKSSFRIERLPGASSTTPFIVEKPAGTRQYNDPNLEPGKAYSYRVASVSGSYPLAWSGSVTATTMASTGTNYTLTINSTNPANGAAIYSFNTATGGSAATGSTPTSRIFPAGTTVTVTCLQTLGTGQQFQKWQVSGLGDVYTSGVTVVMNGNQIITAVYGNAAPPVRTLSNLAISGPASVNENSSAQFTATATFTDASSQVVTPNPWNTNFAAPAMISGAGVLSAGAVTADTVVTVTATYAAGGVPLYATKDVTVRNTAVTETYTLTSHATNGTVTRTPNQNSYTAGSQVVVTATANPGYNFVNWTGASSSTAKSITVIMDGNKILTPQFMAGPPPGTLTVNLSPPAVATAGAQWQFDENSAWNNSGVSATPPHNGDFFIRFKDVPGWTKPANTFAQVTTGASAVLNVSYTQHQGTLQVMLQPADAVAAGGQWRFNGGAWQNSGASVNVPPGTVTVDYKTAGTWTSPESEMVNVSANQVAVATGSYGPPLGQPVIASISPPNGPLSGGTAVTLDGVNFAPGATVTFGGVPATTVHVEHSGRMTAFTPAQASYGTVAVQVNSGGQSASVANGFTYALPRGIKMNLLGQLGGAISAVELAGTRAWIGEGSSLVGINISNVSSLSVLGRIGLPDMVRDIAISGNYAYVANEDAGVQVVDISSASAPASKGFFDTEGQARCVFILGGRAYVADGTAGLQILDLANPLALTKTGGIDTAGAARWVEVVTRAHGVYALVADESTGLQVINVSNPASPVLVTSLNVGNRAECLGISGNYAYVGDDGQGGTGGVKVVDITDPRTPAIIGSVPASWGTWPCYALNVSGEKLWLAGLTISRAYSLANPATPTDLAPAPSGILSNCGQIAGSGNIGFVADEVGLKTYDVTNTSTPVARGSYVSPIALAKRHHASATYAFVCDQNRGLRDISLANPALPAFAGAQVVTNPPSENVFFSGNYSYLCLGSAGIQTISVSNPASPSLSSTFTPADSAYVNDFNASGSIGAYVGASFATQNGRFGLFDMSNPAAPSLRGQISLSATNDFQPGHGVAIKGNYAYVANWNLGLRVVDISNINAPVLRGSVGAANARAVILSGDGTRAFLATGDGIKVIDVANPDSPSIVASALAGSTCFDLAASGNFVFVAAGTTGVVVFDMTDPASPVQLASYDTPWSAWGVDVNGDVVTVSDGLGGLLCLRLADAQPPSVVITNPVFDPTYSSATSTLTLAGAASDNKGVVRVLWSNNRGGSAEATGTTDWSTGTVQLYPGQNVITVTAMDSSGNKGSDVLTVSHNPPDLTPPLVRVDSSTGSAERRVSGDSVTVSGSSNDNVGVVEVAWSNDRGGDGIAAGTTTWTATGVVLQPGANVLTFTARDGANNAATDTATYIYAPLDPTAPTVAISFPTLDSSFKTNSTPLSLAGVAGDDGGVTEIAWTNSRGGEGVATGRESWSVGGIVLKPGLNIVSVTAKDAAGNSDTDTLGVTYVPVTVANRPTVAFSAPAANARVETMPLAVGGSASGKEGLVAVLYQLNDGPWLPAQGTGIWTVSLTPPAGLNVVRIKSLDNTGVESLVVSRTFTRVVRSDLTLAVSGQGTIKNGGFTNPAGLEIGKNYALTAAPKTGWVFAGWSGDLVSSVPNMTFTMQADMAVTATFVENPFGEVSGSYLGLARAEPEAHATSGLAKATVTGVGGFTGTLTLGGKSYPLSGKFDSNGQWVGQILRGKLAPLSLLLMLDVTTGSDTLSGLVSDGTFTAAIHTDRATFKAISNPTPNAGRYTFAIEPEADNTDAPAGFGAGTLIVDAAGKAMLAGKLGDGTAITSTAFVSKNGTWPLHVLLYANTGSVTGEMLFADLPDSDSAGELYWFKPARPTDVLYKTGFETRPQLLAQHYTAPLKGVRILTSWTDGLGSVSVLDGGIESLLSQSVMWTTGNVIQSDRLVLPGLTLPLVPSTGLFSGSFLHPVTRKSLPLSGVLLQKTQVGVGHFKNAPETGSVMLEVAP